MTPHHHHGLFFVAFAIMYFFTNSIPAISAESWDVFQNFTNCRPGQTQNGLSIVKSYFHQFGYMANAPLNNFTDDFDETLVFAIQTYQKNYDLNVTGLLDDSTVRLMMQPRCGVPDDIIENTTTTTSRNWPMGNHRIHLHMVSRYKFFRGSPRWPKGTEHLTYAFKNDLRYTFKRAFARAFSHWAPVVEIEFEEVSLYKTADIKIAFYRWFHGDGFPFDGRRGILAHAFRPTDGHIHMDADELWVALGDVSKSPFRSAVDLESVAVHEIGHALGLRHSIFKEAVMYPSIRYRTRKVNLAGDDIQGMRVLYGLE